MTPFSLYWLQGKQQAAAQQEQIAQLQEQVVAAHQLAEATEQQRIGQRLLASNLQAELEQAVAQKVALQASCALARLVYLRSQRATFVLNALPRQADAPCQGHSGYLTGAYTCARSPQSCA